MSITEIKDLSYGPYERNTLDAYIISSNDTPTPVLIYFHGGGYVSGDKAMFEEDDLVKDCLEAGISVVSCNYRFITEYSYPAPMKDGTRAIQFVRSKAEEWGIDSNKIATAGSSAGGHLALWNALRGDLADSTSSDSIARVSSNVSAFIGYGTQASKDQRFYDPIYNGPHVQPNLPLFYGVKTWKEVNQPDILRLAEEASAITYMSKDAPPAFMDYLFNLSSKEIPADAEVGEVIHHPMHGYILQQEYEKHDIPFVLRHAGNPAKPGEKVQFLVNVFNKMDA